MSTIYELMKSLNAKTDTSIFINLRYLQLKLEKNKENKKKICDIFHIFKNIPCYVTSEVSLKRFHFVLFEDGLTLKTLELVYISFCIQTLHIFFLLPNRTITFNLSLQIDWVYMHKTGSMHSY